MAKRKGGKNPPKKEKKEKKNPSPGGPNGPNLPGPPQERVPKGPEQPKGPQKRRGPNKPPKPQDPPKPKPPKPGEPRPESDTGTGGKVPPPLPLASQAGKRKRARTLRHKPDIQKGGNSRISSTKPGGRETTQKPVKKQLPRKPGGQSPKAPKQQSKPAGSANPKIKVAPNPDYTPYIPKKRMTK